ncbi:ganglioside-induced differentiation-associated protein 1 isoform X2 [Bacillus rossius redtenbacheri]|uniref:ganglioside-induced differentiation-associated protein 1 isoform X2 n=1 Tax=Bacillus rossius redtenbacheri TaxID=93214 RepID=UPI002FDE0CAB
MAGTERDTYIKNTGNNIGNGLLLYHHHFSFYSQKSHAMNLAKGEQYQPWYLQLNPKAEVPVLKDGVKVIPESARIIDYLEDNFSNGVSPSLKATDLGAEVRQKVAQYRAALEHIPAGIITMGSFLHPEYIHNPRLPFIQPIRRLLLAAEKSSSAALREQAGRSAEAREVLLRKADSQDSKLSALEDREEFQKVLDHADTVLTAVERELADASADAADRWLCCERFTVADINLTLILDRLDRLGLAGYFWEGGKKPHVSQYYRRARKRESYRKAVPSTLFSLQTLLSRQAPEFIGLGVAGAVSVVALGILLYSKLK